MRSIIHLSKHSACGTPKVNTNINVGSEGERSLEGSSLTETMRRVLMMREVKLREAGEVRHPFTSSPFCYEPKDPRFLKRSLF